MESEYKKDGISIKTFLWDKDSYALFDFESMNVQKKRIKAGEDVFIYLKKEKLLSLKQEAEEDESYRRLLVVKEGEGAFLSRKDFQPDISEERRHGN